MGAGVSDLRRAQKISHETMEVQFANQEIRYISASVYGCVWRPTSDTDFDIFGNFRKIKKSDIFVICSKVALVMTAVLAHHF
jgi:hypothetical protein